MIDNFYVRTDVGGKHLLVVGLEFLPRPEAVQWATDVLDAYPDDLVIVATHEFLNAQAQRARYTVRDASSPDEIWTTLIRDRANVVAVLSGHWPGPARRTDTGSSGNLIPQMLSNYQWYPHGGSGYLRLLVIKPESRSIDVQSCSPFLNARLRDDGNEFRVRYGP